MRPSKHFISVPVFILVLALTSCTHYYYIPNGQNVPLFQEKNEFRASSSGGGNDEISATDVQLAYSATDHIAVMANAMIVDGGDKSSTSWGRGKYIDGAVGYYKPFAGHAVFEVFAGVGNSNQHHQYDHGTADLYFTKLFLQPSIGVTYNGFDIALTAGISNINFYKINNHLDKFSGEYPVINTIAQNKSSYLFEPSLTIRGGWKYAKIQLQFQSAENLSHSNLQFLYNKVSFGFLFSFAKKFQKKARGKK